MTSPNLENLVKIGRLKLELPSQVEFDGLVHSGRVRLGDATNPALSVESRFDLAYNAAHALALAALRWHGYRPENRYLVFQLLPQTLNLGSEVWRVFAECHRQRNLAEYEGYLAIGEQLTRDLIENCGTLLSRVEGLGPVATKKNQN